jgi:putative transposase
VEKVNESLASSLRLLINAHPTFGYRRLWALLRRQTGLAINRKTVYRILKIKGWFCNERTRTPRPRAKSFVSQTTQSNLRWATDLTHIPCGRDGWGHLAVVIDCHDREVIGFEFALCGRAREAEIALENAYLKRFKTLSPTAPTPTLRSDNGLVFQSKRFRTACRNYNLTQEYVTPYTPEQNGLIERFFRSLKEECVWQENFPDFPTAKEKITRWIDWYNTRRPHQSLNYLSPMEFREQYALNVA